eukprot:scaffold20407_cov192-Isochrysis_galbana.AAC.4
MVLVVWGALTEGSEDGGAARAPWPPPLPLFVWCLWSPVSCCCSQAGEDWGGRHSCACTCTAWRCAAELELELECSPYMDAPAPAPAPPARVRVSSPSAGCARAHHRTTSPSTQDAHDVCNVYVQ